MCDRSANDSPARGRAAGLSEAAPGTSPAAMDISREDISGGGLGGPIAKDVMKALLGK